MIRKLVVAGTILLVFMSAAPAWVAAQEKQEQPCYRTVEFDRVANEKNPQQRAKMWEDFITKFPGSCLLPYVYQGAFSTYNELKDLQKSIEYADKLLALGEKIDLGTRVQAAYIRSYNFLQVFNAKAPDADEQARREREAALQGVELIGKLPKPDNMTPEQFEQQKAPPLFLFHYSAGLAALHLKQYPAAIDSLRSALANNPNDPDTYFRMGVAYLQKDPPQQLDGFWALARSVALKGPGEAQVRSYLRGQLVRYQGGTVCEKETDTQLNELLTLAASSTDRPAGYNIPSATDLDAARKNPEWLNALKNGGEPAKVTWLAMCGLEFPEVYARVFEVAPADASINLKIYTGTTPEDMEAATAPNCEVKVNSQPLAANFQRDDYFRFAGTLASYSPDPFMLTWDNAKINPEDLPDEKSTTPAKRGKRPPTKRVGR